LEPTLRIKTPRERSKYLRVRSKIAKGIWGVKNCHRIKDSKLIQRFGWASQLKKDCIRASKTKGVWRGSCCLIEGCWNGSIRTRKVLEDKIIKDISVGGSFHQDIVKCNECSSEKTWFDWKILAKSKRRRIENLDKEKLKCEQRVR
jgi:hypothetical protein